MPARLAAAGPWVFGVCVTLHLLTVVLWPTANWLLIDMQVYRAGGDHVLHGAQLYDQPVLGPLMFTYPPFAAVLFAPLAVLPVPVVQVLVLALDLVLLYAIARLCLRRLTTARGSELARLSLFAAGLAIWIDPIRITIYLGQINIVLLALVVFDLCGKRGRWTGVGVGIAGAIKLTPLIFVPFLLITRQFRAAAVATGTFAATVVLGFLFAPASSGRFWFGGTFMHLNRVAVPTEPGNQSINGVLLRAFGDGQLKTVLWIGLTVVIGVAGMALAAAAYRRGEWLPAIALVGMLGCAISPFSWNHHWVWPALLLVWLFAKGTSRGMRAALIGFLVCLGLPNAFPMPFQPTPAIVSGWMYAPVTGWFSVHVLHNLWMLVYLAAGIGFARWLRTTKPIEKLDVIRPRSESQSVRRPPKTDSAAAG
ncbi:alpha-1,2-mannosyltransferase [Herbihabitans rhizosphaerae]|uniref:Alpha-1,2-mannosyltransferase n=2 Tax=Herbihabitans rhizosphaerae TaxID=1872711 RepID=A0A4Q7KMB6_9PSEU|nr:alpha-1,2-mannosyltransferase [Herbihabitans rhizosphaerae]